MPLARSPAARMASKSMHAADSTSGMLSGVQPRRPRPSTRFQQSAPWAEKMMASGSKPRISVTCGVTSGRGRLDRDADVLRSGTLPARSASPGDRAVEHVERLGLEVVVADDAGGRVGPRHGDLASPRGPWWRTRRVRCAAPRQPPPPAMAYADWRREVGDGHRRRDEGRDAGRLEDRQVVAEEVDGRDDRCPGPRPPARWRSAASRRARWPSCRSPARSAGRARRSGCRSPSRRARR